MFNIIMRIVLLIIILSEVVLIYDARVLTKKFFSFGDQNEGTSGLKIFGFIFAVIGGVLLFFISK